MKRPSEKLLKEMSGEEIAKESEWHLAEAANLQEEVDLLRANALEMSEHGADETLTSALTIEAEAEAHIHQSNLLSMVRASQLSQLGVGTAKSVVKR